MTNLAKNTENTNVKTSNDLRHTINTHDKDGNRLVIKVRLNDECKNGHQDFSITADAYKGNLNTDRNFLYGGCCHEEILKVEPSLKMFVDLHLCDYTGAPMHASANGFYHLKNGFNNTKPNDKKFKIEFCEYYRITPQQFEKLSYSENEIRFSYNLEKLGIIEQWKVQAKKAIEVLEELTNTNFLIDSKKSQYTPLTDEQKKEEDRKEAEGYYTAEKIDQREHQKRADELEKIKADLKAHLNKEIQKETDEYNVKIEVLNAGLSIDNFIYYNYSNEGVFNWKNYGTQVTKQEFDIFSNVVDYSKLPKGIIFKIGK